MWVLLMNKFLAWIYAKKQIILFITYIHQNITVSKKIVILPKARSNPIKQTAMYEDLHEWNCTP